MDTKHNDDILKTMGENYIRKEGDGQPPATPQPKKQCIKCINYIYNVKNRHYCNKHNMILLHPHKCCFELNRSK